ncbi:conserved hypothetical protein [Oleispira antarctica RB-8]|uniref:TIGR02646 family protein n=1 Tax=Oleispira antarctica RB-8 TaxID=698738 RepID=R4YQA9_OLEAN|nr:conserved hypothetical protein [Oleispira antarctica RB-8]
MKKIDKTDAPTKLEAYRRLRPTAKWEKFVDKTNRRKQAQNHIKGDQGGLCAYCEINLKNADENGKADFRVEHFHPKSDYSTVHNWHLDWQNLLGCCHGGSQANVVEAGERHSSPDHSCDVPKGNENWDDVILNPLNIPHTPILFSFNRTDGAISLNNDNCDQVGVDKVKAQATIDNLRLDSDRLRRLRKAALDNVNDSLKELIAEGMKIEDARSRLARGLLRKNDQDHWPAFFSSLRDYLGSAAEHQLTDIGYIG